MVKYVKESALEDLGMNIIDEKWFEMSAEDELIMSMTDEQLHKYAEGMALAEEEEM